MHLPFQKKKMKKLMPKAWFITGILLV